MAQGFVRSFAVIFCLLLLLVNQASAGGIRFGDLTQQIDPSARPAREALILLFRQQSKRRGQASLTMTGRFSLSGNQERSAATPKPDQRDESRPRAESSSPPLLPDCSTQFETVESCDITVLLCEDCGELPLPKSEVAGEYREVRPLGGGFSRWYLLPLAAIPLAFIPRGEDSPRRTPPGSLTQVNIGEVPTPTPPPPPSPPPPLPPPPPPTVVTAIPEPSTLLLMGSGMLVLGGAVRRRRKRSKPGEAQPVEGESHV